MLKTQPQVKTGRQEMSRPHWGNGVSHLEQILSPEEGTVHDCTDLLTATAPKADMSNQTHHSLQIHTGITWSTKNSEQSLQSNKSWHHSVIPGNFPHLINATTPGFGPPYPDTTVKLSFCKVHTLLPGYIQRSSPDVRLSPQSLDTHFLPMNPVHQFYLLHPHVFKLCLHSLPSGSDLVH